MAKNNMALGQRPANQFEKKLVGIVSVVTGEKFAKFTLVEDGKTFKNGTTSIKIAFDDLPKVPKLPTKDKSGKQYRIRMNSEGTEIEGIMPVTGHFTAKLIDLGPRPEKDADPMPREKMFDEGGPKENRHFEFFAVYKITSGTYKNVQMPAYNLHYKFEEDDAHPGFARFAGNLDNKKATRLHQLYEWMNIHGLGNDPIEWDDETILPELLERALDNDVEVDLIVKDGYIREILPVDGEEPAFMQPSADEDDVDDVDTVFPKEKSEVKPVVIRKHAPSGSAKKVKKPAKVVEDDDEDSDL